MGGFGGDVDGLKSVDRLSISRYMTLAMYIQSTLWIAFGIAFCLGLLKMKG